MTSWAEKARRFPERTVERWLEEVTLTCLEALMDEYNRQLYLLKPPSKPLAMSSMLGHPAGAADPNARGFYPLVKERVANLLRDATVLELNAEAYERLKKIGDQQAQRVDGIAEAGILLARHPQLARLEGCSSAQDLYRNISRHVAASLYEYIANGPEKPLVEPPKGRAI